MASSCTCDLQLDPEMTAARDDLKISPPEMTPCSARRRASRDLLRFSLFVPISASRFRRASARASRSLSGSLEERTNQQCSARASCVSTEDLFFPPPGPRYCVYCTRTRTLGRVPVGSRRPAGAVPQAPSARRRRKIFRGGAGGGRFWAQMGVWAGKLRFWYPPGTPRSRREEHFVIWEVGSIRPSRGC